MKKVKLTAKLSLSKEVIANLNDDQMNTIKGGRTEIIVNPTCNGNNTCNCPVTGNTCQLSCQNSCTC